MKTLFNLRAASKLSFYFFHIHAPLRQKYETKKLYKQEMGTETESWLIIKLPASTLKYIRPLGGKLTMRVY